MTNEYGQKTEIMLELGKQMLEFDKIAKLTKAAGMASVWSKAECVECKCTTWFQGLRGKHHFAWVVVAKKKWVQCNLDEIEWGQKAKKSGKTLAYVDNDVLLYEGLSKDEIADIKDQCERQAYETACGK